jgi:hypothetical protein
MIHAQHIPRVIQNIKCDFCKNRATWVFADDKENTAIASCNVHKRLLETEYNEKTDSVHRQTL